MICITCYFILNFLPVSPSYLFKKYLLNTQYMWNCPKIWDALECITKILAFMEFIIKIYATVYLHIMHIQLSSQ
jgi:hypothetical protein